MTITVRDDLCQEFKREGGDGRTKIYEEDGKLFGRFYDLEEPKEFTKIFAITGNYDWKNKDNDIHEVLLDDPAPKNTFAYRLCVEGHGNPRKAPQHFVREVPAAQHLERVASGEEGYF